MLFFTQCPFNLAEYSTTRNKNPEVNVEKVTFVLKKSKYIHQSYSEEESFKIHLGKITLKMCYVRGIEGENIEGLLSGKKVDVLTSILITRNSLHKGDYKSFVIWTRLQNFLI